MDAQHPYVTVGVHRPRSPGSDPVVLWAADEAANRGIPLRLLHAQEWPLGTDPHAEPDHTAHPWSSHYLAAGRLVLEDARRAALARQPTLAVSTELAAGRPVRVLQEASERAALLVLGTRRFSGLEEAFGGGGKGEALVGHVPCSLALVPRDAWDLPSDANVVVGVDGSPSCQAAVELAFTEAAAWRVGVSAIHVRRQRDPDLPEFPQDAYGELSTLDDCRERYPDVALHQQVLAGNAASVLSSASEGARCLVVGSRGRGGFRGMLLGSTSRALVHRTPCPLLVASSGG